ncbi:hypothetical protein NG821_10830 [Prevotella cerevisiae]|uniref:Uncharacterized protein n=1 Tax=Segatella cerevisiae TaxID=2053716 RepID=A0ABT1BZ10_9BACT|nr:hypothetical protein [Segatella cerevisiae]MCO6026326.1 hypothetical protein [Segatella cerevisiae]
MEWPKELLEIFEDDLLDDVHPKVVPLTADDREVKTLMEITSWSEANDHRMPREDGNSLKEKMLARALKALREESSGKLAAYDRLNLLKEKKQ